MTKIRKVQSDINKLRASLELTESALQEKGTKAKRKVEKLQE